MAQNFSMLKRGFALPAGGTSAVVALPTRAGGIVDIMIYNPDLSSALFVEAGDLNTTATALSVPIGPGQQAIYSAMGATHIAAFRSSGSTPAVFYIGEGI